MSQTAEKLLPSNRKRNKHTSAKTSVADGDSRQIETCGNASAVQFVVGFYFRSDCWKTALKTTPSLRPPADVFNDNSSSCS